MWCRCHEFYTGKFPQVWDLHFPSQVAKSFHNTNSSKETEIIELNNLNSEKKLPSTWRKKFCRELFYLPFQQFQLAVCLCNLHKFLHNPINATNWIESNKMQFAHNCIDFCVQNVAICGNWNRLRPFWLASFDRTKGCIDRCPTGIINSIHADISKHFRGSTTPRNCRHANADRILTSLTGRLGLESLA